MSKIDVSLSDVFDIDTVEVEVVENGNFNVVESKPTNVQSEKIESDYDITRNNLKQLLDKGQEALVHALEVAKQSEHPRAFEVVGNLVKQLADINQQLMDIHQQKQKLDGPKAVETAKNVTNNSIFVGSTTELNKMIKKLTQGE